MPLPDGTALLDIGMGSGVAGIADTMLAQVSATSSAAARNRVAGEGSWSWAGRIVSCPNRPGAVESHQ